MKHLIARDYRFLMKRTVIGLILFLLGSCAGPQKPLQQETIPAFPPESSTDRPALPPSVSTTFPRPPRLESQVSFWRNVYSRWSLAQFAVHDNKHLDLVYEVAELPGTVKEGYTLAQEQFMKDKRADWVARLAELELKARAEAPLSAQEKALAAKITQSAGSNAIIGSSERVRTQRGLRERFKRGLEISGRYHRAISAVFRKAGLPEDLALLPHVESSFQTNARSSAGAVGIWQFTGSAGKSFMILDESIDERLDPVAAAYGAARYLGQAYNKLGSWPLALTSYNHGIGGMNKAKKLFGHDFDRLVTEYDSPQFGFASRNFYAEFLAARDIALQPERYFPEGVHYEPAIGHNEIRLDRSMFITDIAKRYQVDISTLNAINPAWTDKARAGKVAIAAGTLVWLPARNQYSRN